MSFKILNTKQNKDNLSYCRKYIYNFRNKNNLIINEIIKN